MHLLIKKKIPNGTEQSSLCRLILAHIMQQPVAERMVFITLRGHPETTPCVVNFSKAAKDWLVLFSAYILWFVRGRERQSWRHESGAGVRIWPDTVVYMYSGENNIWIYSHQGLLWQVSDHVALKDHPSIAVIPPTAGTHTLTDAWARGER